eukprot:6949429-Pyramimonas_sp.AAC.1
MPSSSITGLANRNGARPGVTQARISTNMPPGKEGTMTHAVAPPVASLPYLRLLLRGEIFIL